MIKDAYYYLFYKYYKMTEASPRNGMPEGGASLAMDIIIFFLLYSFIIYYTIFINPYVGIGGDIRTIIILGILILGSNHFIFHHKNRWRRIVARFDKLPKRKNVIGSWIVLL